MCQTFSEVSGRMQQEQQREPQQQDRRAADGDLGAIVRSASSKQLPPSPSTTTTSHSSTNLGGFMELIAGSSASSSSASAAATAPPASLPPPAGFLDDFHHPNSFLDSLADVVKREPVDSNDMMHDIFSQSRTPMFLASEDIKLAPGFEGLFHHHQQQQQQQHQQQHHHQKQQETAAFQQLHELGAIGRLDLGADSGSPRSVKEEVSGSGAGANSSNLGGSSSKAAAGSKRSRKMQQKRVVLWPTSGNGKPTGDVLPSDNWAWRKYGQKPIKGSPYPRGYYRCSSSKGCSARKQVERSRNDPATLVITYTSEHNHPWPAHRNSLAGTTRIRPIVQQQLERAHQQQAEAGAMEPPANPFVSIVNSPSTSEPMQVAVDTRGTYTPPLLSSRRGGGGGSDGLGGGGGGGSLSSSPEEDFFSELEELPELSTILDKNFLEQHNKSDEEGSGGGGGTAPPGGGSSGAPSLFTWSSPSQQRPQH